MGDVVSVTRVRGVHCARHEVSLESGGAWPLVLSRPRCGMRESRTEAAPWSCDIWSTSGRFLLLEITHQPETHDFWRAVGDNAHAHVLRVRNYFFQPQRDKRSRKWPFLKKSRAAALWHLSYEAHVCDACCFVCVRTNRSVCAQEMNSRTSFMSFTKIHTLRQG